MEAKISDLGQAQQATAHSADSNTSRHTHITREQTSTKLYGTRAYQPTEVQSGGRPSIKSDIFSMGVVSLASFLPKFWSALSETDLSRWHFFESDFFSFFRLISVPCRKWRLPYSISYTLVILQQRQEQWFSVLRYQCI